MSKFVLQQLEDLKDSEFIEAFISLPFRVRAPEFAKDLMRPEQTTRLIHWGIQEKATFWLVRDPQTKEALLRFSARLCSTLPGHGTIGFFEIDLKNPKAREAFLFSMNEIFNWFKAQNIHEVIAPVDINTWFSYRFSLPGKKFFPRFKWEATTPPEYLQLFKDFGFSDYAFFNSVVFPHLRIGDYCIGAGHLKKSFKRIQEQGFSLRPFDMENFKNKELPVFHEISHDAFSDALLFEPIDLNTFTNLYASAITLYDFSPSCVLVDPKGETAGFLFAFYDGDYLVIKSIALRKKYQGLKLSSGMIYSAAQKSWQLNKKGTISAMVRTGLASETIAKNSQKWMWLSWSHEYILVKKAIPHE
jgi:hypothetical protein